MLSEAVGSVKFRSRPVTAVFLSFPEQEFNILFTSPSDFKLCIVCCLF